MQVCYTLETVSSQRGQRHGKVMEKSHKSRVAFWTSKQTLEPITLQALNRYPVQPVQRLNRREDHTQKLLRVGCNALSLPHLRFTCDAPMRPRFLLHKTHHASNYFMHSGIYGACATCSEESTVNQKSALSWGFNLLRMRGGRERQNGEKLMSKLVSENDKCDDKSATENEW